MLPLRGMRLTGTFVIIHNLKLDGECRKIAKFFVISKAFNLSTWRLIINRIYIYIYRQNVNALQLKYMVIHTNNKLLRNFPIMKYLSCAVLFLALFASCGKGKKCYECIVTNVDGTKWKDKSCKENLMNKQYADANGNPLQTVCYELE